MVSALNAVEKRDSEERRVIVDLSWPCGHSVNDGIPSDSYLGEPLVLRFPTIDDIVHQLLLLWVVDAICTSVTFERRTANSQWTLKTILF